MARTTVSEVVERIRRQMQSTLRYEVNVLGASLLPGDTTVTLAYDLPPSLRNGATLAVGTETMRVMGTDSAAKEVTVIRGWTDSDAITHASGLEVWVNPRVTGTDIFEAILDELQSWPTSLYRIGEYQVSVAEGQDTVELPAEWANCYGLLDVRRNWTSMWSYDYLDPSTAWPRAEGKLQRGTPTTWTEGPASGALFRFTNTVGGGNVYFQAALPFSTATYGLTDDLVDDIGMPASMLDIVTMGVQIRLLPNLEIGRSERRAQDDSRRAEEVPPQAALSGVQALFPIYLRRRQEEANRLNAKYPIRWS